MSWAGGGGGESRGSSAGRARRRAAGALRGAGGGSRAAASALPFPETRSGLQGAAAARACPSGLRAREAGFQAACSSPGAAPPLPGAPLGPAHCVLLSASKPGADGRPPQTESGNALTPFSSHSGFAPSVTFYRTLFRAGGGRGLLP